MPLAEAWRSGADRWSSDRLVAYGNDLGYRWSLRRGPTEVAAPGAPDLRTLLPRS